MGRVRAAYGGVRGPLRFEAERAVGLPSVTPALWRLGTTDAYSSSDPSPEGSPSSSSELATIHSASGRSVPGGAGSLMISDRDWASRSRVRRSRPQRRQLRIRRPERRRVLTVRPSIQNVEQPRQYSSRYSDSTRTL